MDPGKGRDLRAANGRPLPIMESSREQISTPPLRAATISPEIEGRLAGDFRRPEKQIWEAAG
jgi:hypothetical protein